MIKDYIKIYNGYNNCSIGWKGKEVGVSYFNSNKQFILTKSLLQKIVGGNEYGHTLHICRADIGYGVHSGKTCKIGCD